MGAKITSVNGNGCAPLKIEGTKLNATHYDSPVASAQVKSCVLLAGLYADGKTSVTEPALSRNHTELMLRAWRHFFSDILYRSRPYHTKFMHSFKERWNQLNKGWNLTCMQRYGG